MTALKPECLKTAIDGTHFAIVELWRGYGVWVIEELFTGENTVVLRPRVHDGQTIVQLNVEDIVFLEDICKNKQAGGKTYYLLLDTDKMNEAAQNKFLKLLEEPVDGVKFVFIAEDTANLLDTVKSRAQMYSIDKISEKESSAMLAGVEATKRQQILFLAEGLPGEIRRLKEDERYFEERKQLIAMAKTLVSGGAYEKMIDIQKLHNDRGTAAEVVQLSIKILSAMVEKTPNKTILRKIGAFMDLSDELTAMGNVRITMADRVL